MLNSMSATRKTTRRADAEGRISLAKLRVWYVDEPETPAETPETPAAETPGGEHGDWFKNLPPEAQKEIEELRNENRKARQAKKKAEEDKRLAEEKSLTEQNEWKTLAEKRAERLAALEPLEEQFAQLEQETTASNAKRVAAIPEAMRSLIPPEMSPMKLRNWLDANAVHFQARQAPDLNPGAGGDGSKGKKNAKDDQQADAEQRNALRGRM